MLYGEMTLLQSVGVIGCEPQGSIHRAPTSVFSPKKKCPFLSHPSSKFTSLPKLKYCNGLQGLRKIHKRFNIPVFYTSCENTIHVMTTNVTSITLELTNY